MHQPYELTPLAERMFAQAGVSADERDRWLQAGFGHHAALNYRNAGANVDEAVYARNLGLSSREVAAARDAGTSLDFLSSELLTGVGMDLDRLTVLRDAGYDVRLVLAARQAGVSIELLERTGHQAMQLMLPLLARGIAEATVEGFAGVQLDMAAIELAIRGGADVDDAPWFVAIADDETRVAWRNVTSSVVDAVALRQRGQSPVDVFDGVRSNEQRNERPRLLIDDRAPFVSRLDGLPLPKGLHAHSAPDAAIETLAIAYGFAVTRTSDTDRALESVEHGLVVGWNDNVDHGVAAIRLSDEAATLTVTGTEGSVSCSDLGDALAAVARLASTSPRHWTVTTVGVKPVDVLVAFASSVPAQAGASATIDGHDVAVVADQAGTLRWMPQPATTWPGLESHAGGAIMSFGRCYVGCVGLDRRRVMLGEFDSPAQAASMLGDQTIEAQTWRDGVPDGPVWDIFSTAQGCVAYSDQNPVKVDATDLLGVLVELGHLQLTADQLQRVYLSPASGVAVDDLLAAVTFDESVANAIPVVAPLQINGQRYLAIPMADGVELAPVDGDEDEFDISTVIVEPIAEFTICESGSMTSGTSVYHLGRTAGGVKVQVDDLDDDAAQVSAWRSTLSDADEVLRWVDHEDWQGVGVPFAVELLIGDEESSTVGAALVDDASETLEVTLWLGLDPAGVVELLGGLAADGWCEAIDAIRTPDSEAAAARRARRRLLGID